MSYYGQYPTYNPFTGQSRGFDPFAASRPAHPFQAPVPFGRLTQPRPQRAASPFDINALGGEVPYRRYDDRPRHSLDEYEAEEQAALAHLRSIQQRRAIAEAEAAREAQIQANAARLARLEAQIEAQRAREARERELAKERERRAIEQELERQRQRRSEQEREAERRRAESRAQWQRNLAVLKQRAIQHAQAQAAAYAERQKAAAVQYARQQAQVQAQRARQACRAACARQAAANQSSNEQPEDNDFNAINSLLGGLFGINLVQNNDQGQETKDVKEKTESKEAPFTTAPEKKTDDTTQHVTFAPDPAEAPLPADKQTSTETGEKTEESPAFPSEINDLLSKFLGLRVEPTVNGEQAEGENKPDVVSGLNKLLGQFGLEFEPDTVSTSQAPAEASTSAASAPAENTETPAQVTSSEGERTTPITSFLNGRYDIPPFVRDILSNVEVALTQGQDVNLNTNEPVVEGKGKGVAEGEKAAKPTPAPVQQSESATPAESDDSTSSTESISKLDSISHELYLATESFTFPSHLTFSQGTDEAPQLLFNKTNSGYHAQAHKLLQLLLQADGISSGGDKDVRRKRKEVVKAVEGAIEALEQKRDEKWTEVREKRERGEEDSEDEWTHASSVTTSPTPSVHEDEPVEHLEEVTPEAIEDDEARVKVSQVEAAEKKEGTAQSVSAEVEEPQEPHSVVFDENDEAEKVDREEPSRAASVHDEEEEQGYEVL